MKIALVLPPITLEERYNKAIAHVAGSLPPLGLLSIGTVLKKAGHDVIVIDGSTHRINEIMAKIEDFRPKIVGITAMTVMWPKAKLLSRNIKEKWPDMNIIIGGVHATLIREKAFLEIPQIDAISWGEGEFSMLEYVNNFSSLEKSASIDGIAFRHKNGEIIIGKDREPIKDTNMLPIPDRSLVATTSYIPAFEQFRRLPVTNMFTTRGCPFQCIFCLPNLLGKGVRYRSVEKVIDEIKYLVKEFGIKDIAFWDDTFTLNKKRVFGICEQIIEKKIKIIWSAQARADCVTPDMLYRMAEAGCWKLFYGVESLVQKNLDTLKKGETVEQIFQAIEWTKKVGIEVEASFIFGIPGETFQEGLETIRLAKKLDPDYAKFFCLTPYGRLLQELDKYGTIPSLNEGNFSGNIISFVPYSMTKEELQKLYCTAYRKFYFRPKMLFKKLKKFNNPVEIKKSIKGLLALATFIIGDLKSGFSKMLNKQSKNKS
jgi:radical SAM superfamily enzyme YgiQ (UPF0313 family)